MPQWCNPVWERQYQPRAVPLRSKAVAKIHSDACSLLGAHRPSFVRWWTIQSVLSCISGARFQCNLAEGNSWRLRCFLLWAATGKNVRGILGTRCYLAGYSSPVTKWCYQEFGEICSIHGARFVEKDTLSPHVFKLFPCVSISWKNKKINILSLFYFSTTHFKQSLSLTEYSPSLSLITLMEE